MCMFRGFVHICLANMLILYQYRGSSCISCRFRTDKDHFCPLSFLRVWVVLFAFRECPVVAVRRRHCYKYLSYWFQTCLDRDALELVPALPGSGFRCLVFDLSSAT